MTLVHKTRLFSLVACSAAAVTVAGALLLACLQGCTPAERQKLEGFERGVDQATELCVKAARCFGVEDVAKACGITDTVLHGIEAAQDIVCPLPASAPADAGADQ